MSDLQADLDHIEKWAEGRLRAGEAIALARILEQARKVANPDYEAAAKAMYDEDDSYGETWEGGSPDVRNWYRRMTKPTVNAALAIDSEDTPT